MTIFKYLAAGSYATELISQYVREHSFLTLEEAHWRLSALPAFCAGFQDRGTLREGAAADIIVYDYEKLDYEFPNFRHDLPGDEYRVASARPAHHPGPFLLPSLGDKPFQVGYPRVKH